MFVDCELDMEANGGRYFGPAVFKYFLRTESVTGVKVPITEEQAYILGRIGPPVRLPETVQEHEERQVALDYLEENADQFAPITAREIEEYVQRQRPT